MAVTLEKEKVISQIWQLVQELTPSEKLSISEQLTAEVRKQLLATEQEPAHFVAFGETPAQLVDESDEWNEQDLAELREASMGYMVTSQVAREEVDGD
jgi:hypothetical protein